MEYIDFASFGFVRSLVLSLARIGFAEPTFVQRAAIPPQMAGRDLVAVAATGSGKTAAYVLPVLHALVSVDDRAGPRRCRALVLVPTRELAAQIAGNVRDLGDSGPVRACLVAGGLSRRAQVARLARGVDLVVATPGRLGDLMRAGALRLDRTRHFVIDEADQLLDMGFVDEVIAIAAATPRSRRTALFSATMPAPVEALARCLLSDPVRVSIRICPAAGHIRETAELVAAGAKRARLAALVADPEALRVIVFCRTRRGANAVARDIGGRGLPVDVIHGERSPGERRAALGRFRAGEARILVATDLVARGIDVPGITHVINYDLPDSPESYVHRVGRTGRNGADGIAVTFCAPREIPRLRAIERSRKRRLLPRRPGRPPAPEA